MDGSEWLAEHRRALDETGRRIATVRRELDAVGVTATSRDRAVTVRVDAQGTLTRLIFTDHAERLTRTRLATSTLEAVGRARDDAAAAVLAAVGPLARDVGPVAAGLRAALGAPGRGGAT